MKRSTAVRHLIEMAEIASAHLRLRSTDIGWPLEELWAAGPFLDPEAAAFDWGRVVLVVDLRPQELPWLSRHAASDWIDGQLRLGKRPIGWTHRPAGWPAWTWDERRVVRYWAAGEGLDERVTAGLGSGELDGLTVVEPSKDEIVAQLERELPVSRAHLRNLLDRYWDEQWRRRRGGDSAEDRLWRAAMAVSQLQDIADELRA